MNRVTIRLKSLDDGYESKEIDIEKLIYNQHDIEFEFSDGSTLPYSDFLWYKDDYEVIVKIKGDSNEIIERLGDSNEN